MAAGAGAQQRAAGARVEWLALGAIMVSSTIIGMTLAFSFPLLSLVLADHGFTPAAIGLNASVNSLAVFVVAPWLPRLVNRLGAVRSMVVGQLICIACLLVLPLEVDLGVWAGLRFALGLGTVLAWVASESAINALANDASRGRVIGVYATLFCVGYAAGPALIGVVGSQGYLPFALSAAVLALGIVPLALARGVEQAMAAPGDANLMRIWRQAPLVLGAILAFGFIETACLALMPLYGLGLGYDEANATLLLSALIAGNVLLQVPLGWLADHAPQRAVLVGCVVCSLVGALAWPHAMGTSLVWPLLVLWGGALGGLYTMSQTLLGQRFRGTDLAVANTAFVMMYELGALGGPAFGGIALGRSAVHGLPLTMAAALVGFLMVAGLSALRRSTPAPGSA